MALVVLATGCAESSRAERVDTCVESITFGVSVGEPAAAQMWNTAGRSDDALRAACDDLATNDPERLTSILTEWESTLRTVGIAMASSPEANDTSCDPSYPAMCIRMNEPDLDCSDVGANDFPVQPPDRHGFDTDGDGFGCVPGADTG